MASSAVHCPKCEFALLLSAPSTEAAATALCPQCQAAIQVYRFPALYESFVSDTPAAAVAEAASCFYHPQKTAMVPCHHCGRFLCSLCAVELHAQYFCPNCLETSQKKGTIHSLENHRTLYDTIALALAIYPIFLIWLTLITAPIAIVFALWHWRSPSSIVPRSRVRLVLAMLIACLQIAGWIMFWIRWNTESL